MSGWRKIKSVLKGVRYSEEYRYVHFAQAQSLGNPYILSEILAHLDLRCLKQARLASKLWDEQACQLLKARTASYFQISDYSNTRQSKTWSRYLKEMEGFGDHPDWKINIHTDMDERIKSKFYQDSENFLLSPKLHPNVKRIQLNLDWFTSGSLLFQILHSKLSLTIEELDLTMYIGSRGPLPDLNLHPASEPLPCLKYLAINFTSRSKLYMWFPDKEAPQNCTRRLLPFCRNVHKISLPSQESYCNSWVVLEICRANDFPHLMEIDGISIQPEELDLLRQFRDERLVKIEINENNWRVVERCVCYLPVEEGEEYICNEHYPEVAWLMMRCQLGYNEAYHAPN